MPSWIEFWNGDTPIYVSERHKQLHYQGIARDIRRLLKPDERVVLDYGCGEALGAAEVAVARERLYLCDAAENTRARLARNFTSDPAIRIVSPDEVAALPMASLDAVIVNSVLQYVPKVDLPALLTLFHDRLKPGGRVILADIIPPDVGPLSDAGALLRFAASGGFLLAAFGGLVRTALSDYRRFRRDLGLSTYTEAEILAQLRERGFEPRRLAQNIGHNPARMAFEASPSGDPPITAPR